VAIAKAEFRRRDEGRNQIARKRQDVHVSAADLLAMPDGTRTRPGCGRNVAVGIGYVEAWLRGNGLRAAVQPEWRTPATAEISRAQVWQWGAPWPDAAGRPSGDEGLSYARSCARRTTR